MARAKRLPLIALAFGSAGLLHAAAIRAQDAEDIDRTPADCVVTTTIDRTQAVDDRTILFFMHGKKIYRNYLPRRCPGLQRQNRIMYKTRGSRLCDVDTITVLEQWGARLEPGFTCSLGSFVPITQEEVDDLLGKSNAARDAIESKPAELPAPAASDGGASKNDDAPAPASPPAEQAPQ
ncbi:MAG TPA: hypothetical protein VFX89_04040 [Gammaproteobacteria bacterium]|nr:hypothetical protein [Gammaproteobacteria bacterium]